MNDSLPVPAEVAAQSARGAQRGLEALAGLGFRRAPVAVTTEDVRVADSWRITQAAAAMGTVVSISLLCPSRDRADDALGDAWVEMQRVVDLLDRYQTSSALGVLNDHGRLSDAPDELVEVMEEAETVARATGGAFDPTVRPLVDLLLERRAAGLTGPPDAADLREATERVGWRHVDRAGRRIALAVGAGLTLDGIAKGYIVDRMAGTLAAARIDSWLVNAGGDIRAAGGRDGSAPWRIGVRDPDDPDRHAQVIALGTGALATSGDYEIHLGPDHDWHHLVDAAGSVSARACRSVTVGAATAMRADAVATAAFVLGPEGALRALPGLAAEGLLITARGAFASPGWYQAYEAHEEGR